MIAVCFPGSFGPLVFAGQDFEPRYRGHAKDILNDCEGLEIFRIELVQEIVFVAFGLQKLETIGRCNLKLPKTSTPANIGGVNMPR